MSPVSSLTSRAAACAGVSPASGWPFGRPSTRLPRASRLTGTITATSSPRTTTPPAENSVSLLIDVALQGLCVVHDEPTALLGDDAGAFEHGQEAARRLARGARELGEVSLGGDDQHVAPRRALLPRRLHELPQHRRDPALHRLEGLAREALVGLTQACGQSAEQLDRDL